MMISCPKCKSHDRQVKAGLHQGRQRYKCSACSHKYLQDTLERGYPVATKQFATKLHRDGRSVNSIAVELNVHPSTVGQWVKTATAFDDSADHHSTRVRKRSPHHSPAPNDGALKSWRSRLRPTLEQVALQANVSKSTVSNYITNTGRMSEDTRERIRGAMEDLNFTPSVLMKGLRQGRTGIIGVYMAGLTELDKNVGSDVAPLLIAGMCTGVLMTGNNLLLFSGWEQNARNPNWQQFLGGHIDGLLWVAPGITEPSLERVAAAGLPVVAVLSRHVPANVGYVNSDNVAAIIDVVQHLYSLGHRRIAYAGCCDISNYLDRLAGYREGLISVGLPYTTELEATGASAVWPFEGFYAAIDRWANMDNRPSVVITPDDRTAIRTIKEFADRGLNVPRDISVTGFDDTPHVDELFGGLTTVSQQFKSIGQLAIEQVMRMLDGTPGSECRISMPTELIARHTAERLV